MLCSARCALPRGARLTRTPHCLRLNGNSINRELRASIDQLQSERERQEIELRHARSEAQLLRQQLADADRRLAEALRLRDDSHERQLRIEAATHLNQDLGDLKSQLMNAGQQLQGAEQAIARQQQLEQQLQEKNKQIAVLQESNSALSSQLAKNGASSEELARERAHVSELTQTVTRLNSQVAVLQESNEALAKNVASSEELARERAHVSELTQTVTRLNSELTAIRQQETLLRQELEQSRTTVTTLQQAISLVNPQLETDRRQRQAAEAQAAASEQRAQAAEARLQALSTQLAEAQASLASANAREAQLLELQNQSRAQTDELLRSLQHAQQVQQQQLVQARQAESQAREQVTSLTAQLGRLAQADAVSSNLLQTNQRLERELALSRHEAANQSQLREARERENRANTDAIVTMTATIATLEREKRALQEEVRLLSQALDHNDHNAVQEREIERLQRELNRVTSLELAQRLQAQEDADVLRRDKERLEERVRECEQRIAAYRLRLEASDRAFAQSLDQPDAAATNERELAELRRASRRENDALHARILELEERLQTANFMAVAGVAAAVAAIREDNE